MDTSNKNGEEDATAYVSSSDKEFAGKILEEENSAIKARRGNSNHNIGGAIFTPLEPPGRERHRYGGQGTVGLALSGGGIRSATFCLGIIQYLACKNLLKYVDYLSTVSGGGYIGSSLTWFIYGDHGLKKESAEDKKFGVDKIAVPYGSVPPTRDQEPSNDPQLRHLQTKGKYLTPGRGITIFSGIAVALRGAIINLLIWIPWLTFMLIVALWGFGWLQSWLLNMCPFLFKTAPDAVLAWAVSTLALSQGPKALQAAFFSFSFGLVLLGLSVLVAASAIYAWFTYGAKLLLFKLDDPFKYILRRFTEWSLGKLLVAVLVLTVVMTVPVTGLWLKYGGGIAALLLSAAGSIWTFMSSKQNADGSERKLPLGLIATLASALFLYGLTVICFNYATDLIGARASTATLDLSDLLRDTILISGWNLFSRENLYPTWFWYGVVFGYFVNVNLTSLHRFYRDRLMETFLPDRSTAAKGRSLAADSTMLADMIGRVARPEADGWLRYAKAAFSATVGRIVPYFRELKQYDFKNERMRGPVHLINTNLIVAATSDETHRIRGGDSFILSPLYCGSAATGWRRTDSYMRGQMSLATAMAISGAAANPNAACGGTGVTRSVPVALLMTLFNVRLGYWVPHPYHQRFKAGRPNHYTAFWSAVTAAVGFGSDENRLWLQLSDGGHFDNTGIYELLRRKVKLIIACDGSADPTYSFSDLLLVLERGRADFRITWKPDTDTEIDDLVPIEREDAYPLRLKESERGFMLIRIRYPGDPTPGLIVFMTTTMIGDLGISVRGYKAAYPDFPDQSTGDQFFDERQVEAYRELGWCIARQMEQMTGMTSIPDPTDASKSYLVVPQAKGAAKAPVPKVF